MSVAACGNPILTRESYFLPDEEKRTVRNALCRRWCLQQLRRKRFPAAVFISHGSIAAGETVRANARLLEPSDKAGGTTAAANAKL